MVLGFRIDNGVIVGIDIHADRHRLGAIRIGGPDLAVGNPRPPKNFRRLVVVKPIMLMMP